MGECLGVGFSPEADLQYACSTKKSRVTGKDAKLDELVALQHATATDLTVLLEEAKALRSSLTLSF